MVPLTLWEFWGIQQGLFWVGAGAPLLQEVEWGSRQAGDRAAPLPELDSCCGAGPDTDPGQGPQVLPAQGHSRGFCARESPRMALAPRVPRPLPAPAVVTHVRDCD